MRSLGLTAGTINWDSTSMTPWFNYAVSAITHTAWFENKDSTDAKLNVSDRYDVAGIFIWRLGGGEDPGTWNIVNRHYAGTSTLPVLPTANIKADSSDGPIVVAYNATATISWTSTNASSCSVSPAGWSGLSNSGTSTGRLTASIVYSLSCTNNGATATDSVAVIVSAAPTDTTAPVVSLVTPLQDAVLSVRQDITAKASDNVGVTQVLLYIDNTLLATDTVSPYATAVNTKKYSPGQHVIKAVAYDAAGNSSTAQVNVTVR